MSDSNLPIEQKLDSLCDEYENNWSDNSRSDIQLYLNQVEQQYRDQLLQMLLELDIELRLKTNQFVQAEDYSHLGPKAVSDAAAIIEESTDQPVISDSKSADLTATFSNRQPASQPKQIGQYRLLQQIGEGGMGTVWMADQEKPVRRRVALKLIKDGRDNKEVLARFEAERQAIAMMDHQNIAKVLDGGTADDGRPYFVMELVKGIPITKYCDDNKLDINQRLKLFVPVCKAIQHAHQKGIIHRDLKPSNVLVTLYDGQPVPKVIDFGLAKALEHTTKLTDKTMFTEFGQVVGTVQYMSPEQAEMNQLDVDTRTDVYSLGVMLYELLTGSTPLDHETMKQQALLKVLEIIRETEPPRPSTRLSSTGEAISGISQTRKITPTRLQQILKGELDWLVMKALEKDRSRRYESASSFADDIERYLSDEPVLARPPSTGYRVQKFVRKNRSLVASVSVMLLLLLAGLAGTSWFAYRANQSANEEKRQRNLADASAKTAKEKTREAEASAKRSQDVLQIVTGAFLSTNPDAGGTKEMTAVEVLLNAQKALDTSELDDEGKDALLIALGVSFMKLGKSNLAIPVLEAVLPLRSRRLGEDHPDTLRVMSNLATSYYNVGRQKEALELRESLVPLFTEKLGADHRDTLSAIGMLANSYESEGRLKKSLEMREQLVSVSTEKLGVEHLDTLRAMLNLAVSLDRAGQIEKAMKLNKKVISVAIEKLGANHSLTLMAMNNLASSNAKAGRQEESLKLRTQILTLRSQKLGPDHPDILSSKAGLAISYFQVGRIKDAVKLWEEVLPLMSENPGSNHPKTLQVMRNLAIGYSRTDQHEKALDLAEQLAKLVPNNLTFQVMLGGNLSNMAEKEIANEKWKAAHDLLKRAIATQKQVLKADPKNRASRTFLANHYKFLILVGKGLEDPELVAEAERGLKDLNN